MRTARSLSYGGLCPGGLPNRDYPQTDTPLSPGLRPPWTETPPDRDPPLDWDPLGQRHLQTETTLDRDPPGQRPPRQRSPWTETPPDKDPAGKRTPLDRDNPQVMWPVVHAGTETPPPPVNRMEHACENITLLQLHCYQQRWREDKISGFLYVPMWQKNLVEVCIN